MNSGRETRSGWGIAIVSAYGRATFLATVLVLVLAVFCLRPASRGLKEGLTKVMRPARSPMMSFAANELLDFDYVERVETGRFIDVSTDDWISVRLEYKPRSEFPGDVYFSVYYYPDATYAILHTPEVCYRAAGWQIKETGTVKAKAPLRGQIPVEVEAKYLHLSEPNESGTAENVTIYGLCCNDQFFHDRESVRAYIGLPWNRSLYLAKVECTVEVLDPEDLETPLLIGRILLEDAMALLIRDQFPI